MAYADTRPRPSPTSMGAAIALNALIIAGVILAAPHITGDAKDGPLMLSFYPTPKPPIDPVAIKKLSVEGQSVKSQSLSRPDVINKVIESTNIVIGTDEIDLPPLGQIGPVGEIGIEPVIKQPVFIDAILNPRYRDALQPAYPPGLIRREVEGIVTIKVLVGTDGRVKTVEPVRYDDLELLRVTEQHALRKWRFLPATRDGVAVESWREMSVRFEIPD